MPPEARRIKMIRQIESVEMLDESPVSVRNLTKEDKDILGDLLYFAYKGTIDDDGQSLEEAIVEADQTLKGKYGAALLNSSYVAIVNEEAVCVTVVTAHPPLNP